ncbi:biotin-dependent carboxyltransferase [SAR202 cluster bacterium AD-802-E10_MRT_200m]|nr:biotin-dependent carboxyltransferase [SAR202 cluster bacterium AD-802-E10_MRT_200m]
MGPSRLPNAFPRGCMLLLEVLDSGFLTTIQDLGRKGFLRYGIPHAGAMDTYAHRVGNLLIGNPVDAATLEVTLPGARFRILTDTVLVVTGADLGCELNGIRVKPWLPFPAPGGAILNFTKSLSGIRSYIGVLGGIDVPLILGSRSTYSRSRLGGLEGRALSPGDLLGSTFSDQPDYVSTYNISNSLVPSYDDSIEIRVILGPQQDSFTAQGLKTFLTSLYTISDEADRTGYRLSGPKIEHISGADIISDGNPLGAIQVSGDGMPIILLADRGTTGGYAKIATIISVDIAKLAQAGPGDQVKFIPVELEQAYELLRQQENGLNGIGTTDPTFYVRRRFRLNLEGNDQEILTSFFEANVLSKTVRQSLGVRVSLNDKLYEVEIEEI